MVATMVIQLLILFNLRGRFIGFRYIVFFLLEFLLLGGALYYAVKQPAVPYLGWEFRAAMCLWLAGAALLGYLLAWGIYALKTKSER